MSASLFSRYASAIRNFSGDTADKNLLMDRDGPVSIHYAPFDYTNEKAKVVVVGITPGKTQMLNAVAEARRQMASGATEDRILAAAKRTASFSGAMRPNLVGLLNKIGLNQWLGITSCDALFGSASELVQTTSVLRFPVFVDGENYNGTPNMLKHPLLRRYVIEHFGKEAQTLKDAVFVPLGDKVAETLRFLVSQDVIKPEQVLDGLPHPSGANAERIAYFLGNKSREALSAKTDPVKLDRARECLCSQVQALG